VRGTDHARDRLAERYRSTDPDSADWLFDPEPAGPEPTNDEPAGPELAGPELAGPEPTNDEPTAAALTEPPDHDHDEDDCPVCSDSRRLAEITSGLRAPSTARSRRGRVLAGLVLVAALIAGVIIALITTRGSDTRPTPRQPAAVPAPAPSAPADPAIAWIVRELATDSRFVADPVTVSSLRARKFGDLIAVDGARTIPSASRAALQFDYVVATASLRASAAANAPLRSALAGSVPIAVFGSGTSEVVVRQVSALTGRALIVARTGDAESRRTGERQLLRNRALHVSPAARAVLEAGGLDLRPATVLALLANSSTVDLVKITVDAPERSAGLSARTIEIRTDDATAAQAVISNLPVAYKPTSDTMLPDGAEQLVWPITPIPPNATK
jgi:hypothetical protein